MEKSIKIKKPTEEEIIHNTFNTLRTEQRQLATKLSEIEIDLNEHRCVNLLYEIIIYVIFKRKILNILTVLLSTL